MCIKKEILMRLKMFLKIIYKTIRIYIVIMNEENNVLTIRTVQIQPIRNMITAIKALDFFNSKLSGKNCNEQGCELND